MTQFASLSGIPSPKPVIKTLISSLKVNLLMSAVVRYDGILVANVFLIMQIF